jgi:hypothetical protein
METGWARTQLGRASLLGLLLLLLLPTRGAAEGQPPLLVRFHAFPNGLGIYHVKVEDAKKFQLSATVWVGSADEDPKKSAGVSHLLEHILFHQPDVPEKEFKGQVYVRGGRHYGGTSSDYTDYDVTLPARHLDFGQKWLHKVLFHNLPVTARLEQAKEIVNRENRWSRPTWWQRLWTFIRPEYLKLPGLWENQFGLPEYDEPLGGTYQVASRLTADQLEAHYRAYYYPENMVLLYAGPHRAEEVIAALGPTFGTVPPTGRRANLAELLDHQLPRPYFSHRFPGAFLFGKGGFDLLSGSYDLSVGHVYRGLKFSQRSELVLYQLVLSNLLQDRFRYEKAETYSVFSPWAEHRGAGFIQFSLSSDRATYRTQLHEVEEFVWGNDLGKHLSREDYERYKTTFLENVETRDPENFHARIWEGIRYHPLHRPSPDEADIYRRWHSLAYEDFLEWSRNWRAQTAPLLELSMPAVPFAYAHILVFALFIGFGAHLARFLLRRPHHRENIRLITRLPDGILGWIHLGLLYGVAAFVYFHLSWASSYGLVYFSRSNALALVKPYLHWTVDGFLIGLCLVLGGLTMPRKVLVTDRALVVRMRSPLFCRIPLADIQSVESVSGWTAWSQIVRLRALPVYPWFWRGLLIRRRSGRALVLHTKDDRELLEMLRSREPWQQIELESSTVWAGQAVSDIQHSMEASREHEAPSPPLRSS